MIVNGIPVNFGFASTANGITISGISGALLQSSEESAEAEREITRGGQGDVVMSGWYDAHRKAELEWVITSGTSNADAITNTTLTGLTPGAFISISACASHPSLVANWEVVGGAKIMKGNTNVARIRVPIEKRSTITAVAT